MTPESKHVATFIIDNKLVVFLLYLLLEYFTDRISSARQNVEKNVNKVQQCISYHRLQETL
jgi:hypothetical protein